MKNFVKNSVITTKLFFKDNTLTLIFMTLFTVGTVLGAFSFSLMAENSATLIEVMKHYFDENASLSILSLFSRNLISNFIVLGVMYGGGLCAIGLPVIGIIPTIKGVALGAIISYQYVFFGMKGFLYALTIIFLPAALLLTVFNFAYTEGIYMSLTVSNGVFNGKPRQVKYDLNFVTFTKRFLIFALSTVVISFIESVLCSVFSKVI